MTRSIIGAIVGPSDNPLRHRPKFGVQARLGPTLWRCCIIDVRWGPWIPEKLSGLQYLTGTLGVRLEVPVDRDTCLSPATSWSVVATHLSVLPKE